MFKIRRIFLIIIYAISGISFFNVANASNPELEDHYSQEVYEKKLPKATSKIINSIISKTKKENEIFDNNDIDLNQGYIKPVDNKNELKKLEENTSDKMQSQNPLEYSVSISEEHHSNSQTDKLLNDASLAYQIGHIEVATTLYQKILSLSHDNTEALFGLATIYYMNKQIDEARSLFTKLLTIEPNNQLALNNFLALAGEEAPIEAIKELKKLESVNSNTSLIPAQIAIIYTNLGNYSKAIKYFNKAIILSPENLLYRYNLAVILDKIGEREKSIELYKQILRQNDPDNNPSNFDLKRTIEKRLRYLNNLQM